MRTNRALLTSIGMATLAISGCATIEPRPGFDDVRHLVSARTKGDLEWTNGSEDDAAVNQHVHSVLTKPLAPDGAVQIALLRNRRLQATYAQLGIAQADLVQAGLLQNPVLTADVRFGLGVTGTGADVGLVQEFLSILQIPLRKRVAAASFEAAKLDVATAAMDLAARVKRIFFTLQGAEQMLELRRTVLESNAAAAELAGRQHAAGNISDLDLANEQATYEQARVDLNDAETAALTQHEELTELMGLWGEDTAWTIDTHLPQLPQRNLDIDGLESLAVSQRIDLRAADQQRTVVANNLGLTRLYGLIPEGSAGVAAQREVEGGVWSLGPSIGLPIPIFDQRQATLASYRNQLAQTEDRFAALAVEIRSEVRRARLRTRAAWARADYYQRVVLPLRVRVVEQTQREYNGMLVGVFQLLQAKRDEIEGARRYIEALTEYWVSCSDLEHAVGGDLPAATAVDAPPSQLSTTSAGEMPAHHHHGD